MLGPVTKEAASGLWRSEDMVMLQIHMQREAAHESVLKLGQLGMFQFNDLNQDVNAFQKTFANEVRRCDEMERKLRYFSESLDEASVVAVAADGGDEIETLDSLERKIDDREGELRDISARYDALQQEENRTREYGEVLSHDRAFVQGDESEVTDRAAGAVGEGLGYITGVMPTAKIPMFERLVYRATRGNSFMRTNPIKESFRDPVSKETVEKCVFVVFFSARRAYEKIKRLCESLGATLYNFVENHAQLEEVRRTVQSQKANLQMTIRQTSDRRDALLGSIARDIVNWKSAVLTEKAVYSTMNLLRFKGSTVTAIGWCPKGEYENIQLVLRDAQRSSGSLVSPIVEVTHTRETPPTFFRTNKITSCFQGIVDSYGVARYKEVNPGVLTIVTFPYLFGVMYGDLGHGLLLTVFAAYLIIMERQIESKPINEIFGMLYGGRYLLFGMGVFGSYIGILYNDMFGISTELFPSGYKWPQLPPNGPDGIVHPTSPSGNPSVKPMDTVMFGIDSAWAETENKLEFYNSVKMKCAVIIGIVQMVMGICFSLMNYRYFNQRIHMLYRFIPEMIFMLFTFGYMALMIIIKWTTTWENTHDAPSLLETMTNFFLAPGTVTSQLYSGQAMVQVVLLLIAFAQVPILLCGIPYFEKKEHEEKMKHRAEGRPLTELNRSDQEVDLDEEEDHFDYAEIVIHQVIHTIEFVLGCVSNTASYLRLWALSLAHSQLSEVFWNFAFMMALGADEKAAGVTTFIGFGVWLTATIGVLLMMEALSSFLHALRLHWVEFQSKFYNADGIAFTPFSLDEVLAAKSG